MFQYPNEKTKRECERAAARIRALVQRTIESRIAVGAELNAVKEILPHGQFGPWLEFRFPGWSQESTRRWRVMAYAVQRDPQLGAILLQFRSIKAAEEFIGLPEKIQRAVLDAEAFAWNDYHRVVFASSMQAHLEDEGTYEAKVRLGDVYHWCRDALDDPVLADTAAKILRQHADDFAELSARPAAEALAEAGLVLTQRRPPPEQKPWVQFLEDQTGNNCPCCGRRLRSPLLWDSLIRVQGEQRSPLAVFPHSGEEEARGWVASLITAAKEKSRILTLDGLE